MLPIEDDAPTTLPAQMCGCGAVWLMPWALGFVAEGREHMRGRPVPCVAGSGRRG